MERISGLLIVFLEAIYRQRQMLSDNDRQKINEIYISFSNFHERLVLEEEWEGKDLMEEIMKKNVTLNDLSYTFQAE